MREELREALACCREKRCDDCPLVTTICDELRVDMVDIPEELIDSEKCNNVHESIKDAR